MGKKPGWLRRIFGGKKSNDSPPKTSSTIDEKNKCSNSTKNNPESFYTTSAIDADNKHAIAVAAATAAVAEAAVAAAKAAAEVVRLTSGSGRCAPTACISRTFRIGEVEAAVKIQSAFRAYLARRALRALKALVKLQALVRGHIVRKQTADMLRRMQALARVQARARASRARMSESYLSSKFSLYHHPGPSSPIKYQRQLHVNSAKFDNSSLLKRCGSNSNKRDLGQNKAHIGSNSSLKPYADDEKTDRILEVDTWRPHLDAKQINRSFQTPNHVFDSHHYDRPFIPFDSPSRYSTKARYHVPDIYYREASSLSSLKFPTEADEATLWTDECSPTLFSSSSRPGSSLRRRPFSPTRSECSRSFYSGCSNYPHYMSNTESYRAKVRSQSAPRQRIELFEKYGSTRSSVHGFPDPMTSSHGGSTLAEFRNKVYYQDSTR